VSVLGEESKLGLVDTTSRRRQLKGEEGKEEEPADRAWFDLDLSAID